jgi:hypothetical protein
MLFSLLSFLCCLFQDLTRQRNKLGAERDAMEKRVEIKEGERKAALIRAEAAEASLQRVKNELASREYELSKMAEKLRVSKC